MPKQSQKQQVTIKDEPVQRIYKTRKQLFVDNLIGGVAWGLGSGLGATLVLALLGYILSQSQELPFIGQIVENAMNTLDNSIN